MLYIEVPDKNDSISRITLSGKEYYIRFTYNRSYDYWSMTKIVPFSPLTYFYTYTDLPDGDFGCFSVDKHVGRNAFKEKKAKFVYIPNSEL